MKYFLFTIFFFIICSTGFPQVIPVYDLMQPTILKIGNGEGEVGYNKNYGGTGGFAGPKFYTFSTDGNFYICDYRNKRINMYDPSFTFIKTINPDKKIEGGVVNWMEINSNGNMACILYRKGLFKIDNTGQTVFTIPIERLPESVSEYYNFFSCK